MEFAKLFAVDSKAALRFFYHHLKDLNVPTGAIDKERLYVASILASYAQASPHESDFLPPLPDLASFFDRFVLPGSLADITLLQEAGAQNLFLNGFLRDQMRRRHNVEWYDAVGQAHYRQAAELASTYERHILFSIMAERFPEWTRVCCRLHQRLREERYVLRLN